MSSQPYQGLSTGRAQKVTLAQKQEGLSLSLDAMCIPTILLEELVLSNSDSSYFQLVCPVDFSEDYQAVY